MLIKKVIILIKAHKHIQIMRTTTTHQSSMGQKSCDMIYDVLRNHYDRVGVTIVNNEADLQSLVELQPDLVFVGLKRTSAATQSVNYSSSDSIWVSKYLDDNGINYTGSKQPAIELDLHKNRAKQIMYNAGLPTAQSFMALPGQYDSEDQLPLTFPLFIKPPTQGGGKGIAADSVARSFLDFEQKVQQIYEQFATPALVETYLEGREFSVAILGSGYDLIVMPIELIADRNENGDRILSSKVKLADTERATAVPDGPIRDQLTHLATNMYRELGARDYGRIDMRMNTSGNIFFLEANLVPGLANNDFISYFTHAYMLNGGSDYKAMILKIVRISLMRSNEPSAEKSIPSYVLQH